MTQDTESTTVRITPVQGPPDALLHVYPGQQAPQGCYIALDLRDGSMWADYNGEIGNAVPFEVFHGLVRRYSIPPLQPETVNALMHQITPDAQVVLDMTGIVWDGSNYVARLSDAAQLAEARIAATLDPEDLQSDCHWWEADDWLAPERHQIKLRIAEGESLDALYDELQGDGGDEDTPVVIGLMPALEQLADEARSEGETNR